METDCSCVKLSVVVPVYNIASYIDRCVESIVRQSYRNLEIILVDDGSSDGSGEKCDLWAQRDARVFALHRQNGGLVSARQAGVEAATGEYLAYVDGDDWIDEMYAEMLDLAVSCDADIVTLGLVRNYAGHTIIHPENVAAGIYRGKKLEEEFWPRMIDSGQFFRSRVNGHITTKIYKTTLIKKFQMRLPADITIGEDAAVVYPCFLAADCVAVLDRNSYHYVMRAGSVMDSRGGEEKSLKAIEDILNEAAERYEEKVPNIKRQFEWLMTYICLLTAPEKVLGSDKDGVNLYKGLKKTDRIVLYGAGRFGKALYRYMEDNKVCEILAWTDKARVKGIVPVEEAMRQSYDKVVIAVLLADVSEEIKAELLRRGIESEKIAQIQIDDVPKRIKWA